MNTNNDCVLHQWLAEPPTTDVRQAIDKLTRLADARHIAVMPDVHKAENVCVGVVLATARNVYPDAVGGDIGCGMAAMALDKDADALADPGTARRLLALLQIYVQINRRGPYHLVPMADEISPERLTMVSLRNHVARDGKVQLGTLGGGNHFVELQADQQEQLWLMIHSGSRGMGQQIRAAHTWQLPREAGLPGLPADSPVGQAYLADMAWAVAYARENRRALLDAACDAIAEVLRAAPLPETYFDCCHNYVRREMHGGSELYVHRKGTISAAADEPGIIPGSMGTCSYHVAGRGLAESLCSSSHGAGRRLSRAQAAASYSAKDLRHQMGEVVYDESRGRDLRDEAPKAYRDIRKVMRAQADLTRITRTLLPLLCHKGV